MKGSLPQRKQLHHTPPNWVPDSDLFFITVNGEPRGPNQFAKNETGTFILKSAKYYQENEHWFCRLILVMPDHIHALVAFPNVTSMERFITSWKSYLSKHCKIRWQRGFFDHRIRSWKSLDAKAEYISQNPVRAGLVKVPADWPWRWDFFKE